jgi:MerR HTH family regulatory protein
LERNPAQVLDATSSMPLHELVCRVGVLNHLLQRVVEPLPIPSAPAPPLTGLTLQAVSWRTGIPAATLQTWERSYGFVRPPRSASGYRLYGQEELRAILHVKRRGQQGVGTSQAMATVARDR